MIAYVLVGAALLTPVVQFQYQTSTHLKPGQTKKHIGAIGRWRLAVEQFWEGRNIYMSPSEPVFPATAASNPTDGYDSRQQVLLHPNMPFVVILLTPFASMPVGAMALTYNLLKIAVFIMACLMAVSVCNHQRTRMADWIVGLGLLWGTMFVTRDIQHGNTNTFVLGAVVLSLWLYRKGHDLLAGVPLALAICLKLTPALFLLYWAYQRNWKLLAATVVTLAVMVVVVPAAAIGVHGATDLTTTWLDNLIIPGLVKGAWYPEHINQSMGGVLSRYLLSGPNGNIFWSPDDNPYSFQKEFGWINFASLDEQAVKAILRACQLGVLALMAWAIGVKKLPRDDGRRGLHYAMVALGMMILNQRTWDHHATVLLPAVLAVWYAIVYADVSKTARRWAIGLTLAAGLMEFLLTNGAMEFAGRLLRKADPEVFANVVLAYGTTFYQFVLLFGAAVILSVNLKKSPTPYLPAAGSLSRVQE